MSQLWPELVAAALLGTDQRPFTVPQADDSLSKLLSQIDPENPEQALLSAAALTAMYRRAGNLPAHDDIHSDQPLPPAHDTDDLPRCSPRAASFLGDILNGNRGLLPEYLTALAAARQRLPEEKLPELLKAGTSQTSIRALIATVIGKRGRWLAAQNEQWHYAALPDKLDESLWETAEHAVRLKLLEQVRGQNPAHGRELLLSTWKEDTAEQRKEMIEVLTRSGLSMDDEPFLEDLLDSDRAHSVREAAHYALAHLPESRLVGRMIERTRTCLKAVRGEDGALAIDVTLPEAYTDDIARDTIVKQKSDKLGKKGYWLQQMLYDVPLSLWGRELHSTAAEIVQAAAKGEWSDVLLNGWAVAAVLQNDTTWAAAIVRTGQHVNDMESLIKVFPPDLLEKTILELMKTNSYGALSANHPAIRLLRLFTVPWSPKLTAKAFEWIAGAVEQPADEPFGLRHYFRHNLPILALHMRLSPRLLRDSDQLAHRHQENAEWARTLTDFADTLRFRYEIHKEIDG